MTTTPFRLTSLDAFRGFTIAAMFLVNNPGDWNHLYPPLAHASWDGWTLTDCIFPFFLFIVGASLHLSLANKSAKRAQRGELYRQLFRRAAIIFCLGLFLNFIPNFDIATVRILGVLQRIALCSALAGVIVIYCSWRQTVAWVLGILFAYTAMMLLIPVPDAQGVWGTGVLEPGRDLGVWIDRALLDGHLWKKSQTWDPEGLLSSLPATASVLIGALFASLITHFSAAKYSTQVKIAVMLVFAGACIAAGAIIDVTLMPINKSLWSTSFCLLMSGLAMLVFVGFYFLLDAMPSLTMKRKMVIVNLPFTMYGRNALFLFVFASVLAKLMGFVKITHADGVTLSLQKTLFAPLTQLPISPLNVSLLFAVLFNFLMHLIAYVMWKRAWFIKV